MSVEGVDRIRPISEEERRRRKIDRAVIRAAGIEPARRSWRWWWGVGATLAAVAYLLSGCASDRIVATFGPGAPGEGGTFAGGEAARPVLLSLSVEPTWYGRGCYVIETAPDGTWSLILAVDATSDWAGIRALPLVLPEMVAAAVGIVNAVSPMELLGKLLGVGERGELPPPSPLSACEPLLVEDD